MTGREIGLVLAALERYITRRRREYERTADRRAAYFAAHPDRADADAMRLRDMESVAERLQHALDGDVVIAVIPERETSAFLNAIDDDDEAPEVLAIAARIERSKIEAVGGHA